MANVMQQKFFSMAAFVALILILATWWQKNLSSSKQRNTFTFTMC